MEAYTDSFRLISNAIQFAIFVPYGIYLLKKSDLGQSLAKKSGTKNSRSI